MFDYIKIEGFRSFKKVELEMPSLAVLIGPNGGGKSNLLDLLKLMAEAGRGELASASTGAVVFAISLSDSTLPKKFALSSASGNYRSSLPLPPNFQVLEPSRNTRYDIKFNVSLRGSGDNFRVWEEKLRVESPDDASFSLGIVDREAATTAFRWSSGADPQIVERKSVVDTELAIFQVRDPNKYAVPYAVLQNLQEWTFVPRYRRGTPSSSAPARLA